MSTRSSHSASQNDKHTLVKVTPVESEQEVWFGLAPASRVVLPSTRTWEICSPQHSSHVYLPSKTNTAGMLSKSSKIKQEKAWTQRKNNLWKSKWKKPSLISDAFPYSCPLAQSLGPTMQAILSRQSTYSE